MTTNRLAVIDLETTGLNPATGLILEVGIVVIDTALNEIAHRSVLLADQPAVDWARRTLAREAAGADLDIPERMHLDNGLVADLLNPVHFLSGEEAPFPRVVDFSPAGAAQTMCMFLDQQGITAPVPLTGSSVRSLDGPFLAAHMPELFSRFSHRTIDASALTEFAKFVDPSGHAAIMAEVPAAGHRTVEDCRRSLEIIRRFASCYRIGELADVG